MWYTEKIPTWQDRTGEAYTEYFVSILENLDAFTDFDVYGHIDYVVRYGPNRNADYTYAKYADVLDEIFKKLISLDRALRSTPAVLNTGLATRILPRRF